MGKYRITKKMIKQAKEECPYLYGSRDILHEHPDCIRMAYEWLDAQNVIKGKMKHFRPLKHIIECWCDRYVSRSDVEVAAFLHPNISGKYPRFNLSSVFILPEVSRLKPFKQAFKHNYAEDGGYTCGNGVHDTYRKKEVITTG